MEQQPLSFSLACQVSYMQLIVCVAGARVAPVNGLLTSRGQIFLPCSPGAFVAGLDAGLVYNSFPKMAGQWIPEDITSLSPKPINVLENPTTVQFNHRWLVGLSSNTPSSLSLLLSTSIGHSHTGLCDWCMGNGSWCSSPSPC